MRPDFDANKRISDEVMKVLLHFLERGTESSYSLDITNLMDPIM